MVCGSLGNNGPKILISYYGKKINNLKLKRLGKSVLKCAFVLDI